MIFVVAPEPADWLAALPSLLARWPALPAGPLVVFAPWAAGGGVARAAAWLPARARAFFARRELALPEARVQAQLGGLVADALVGAWAGRDVGRRLAARFWLRRAVGALAARHLPAGARAVVAPSGAAERVWAAAEQQGAERLLLMDLPLLRRLHDDLDQAAARHPTARFLRRYRAAARDVARQEMEWVLASRIVVRSDYAAEGLRRAGVAAAKVITSPAPSLPPSAARGRRVLLAGGATARGGAYEALDAVRAVPGATLLVSPGEGAEPADLLSHACVRAASPAERDELRGVDAVIAPSWCEAHPRELALARRVGLPRITTPQVAAAGDTIVPRGQPDALARALAAVAC